MKVLQSVIGSTQAESRDRSGRGSSIDSRRVDSERIVFGWWMKVHGHEGLGADRQAVQSSDGVVHIVSGRTASR